MSSSGMIFIDRQMIDLIIMSGCDAQNQIPTKIMFV